MKRILMYLLLFSSICQASSVVSDVEQMLVGVEGVTVSEKSGSLVLDGKLKDFNDVKKIEFIMNQYPHAINLVTDSSDAYQKSADKMNDQFSAHGLANLKARVVGKTFMVEGEVKSEGERIQAQLLAEESLPPFRLPPLVLRKGRGPAQIRDPINFFVKIAPKE